MNSMEQISLLVADSPLSKRVKAAILSILHFKQYGYYMAIIIQQDATV